MSPCPPIPVSPSPRIPVSPSLLPTKPRRVSLCSYRALPGEGARTLVQRGVRVSCPPVLPCAPHEGHTVRHCPEGYPIEPQLDRGWGKAARRALTVDREGGEEKEKKRKPEIKGKENLKEPPKSGRQHTLVRTMPLCPEEDALSRIGVGP